MEPSTKTLKRTLLQAPDLRRRNAEVVCDIPDGPGLAAEPITPFCDQPLSSRKGCHQAMKAIDLRSQECLPFHIRQGIRNGLQLMSDRQTQHAPSRSPDLDPGWTGMIR
jgi:hypothetical protein